MLACGSWVQLRLSGSTLHAADAQIWAEPGCWGFDDGATSGSVTAYPSSLQRLGCA